VAGLELMTPAAGPTRAGPPAATGWSRALWLVGGALLVTMVAHVVALLVGGGPVTGPVSLRKPATFAETGWLLAWSVALVLPTLRARAWQRTAIAGTAALFAVGETAIIAVQAWRGVPSHYNFTTPFDTALMRGGAAGTAGLLVLGLLVLLVTPFRPDAPAAVRLGVRAGVAVLLAGCAVGLVMVFTNSGVYQGSLGAGFPDRTSGYLGPDAATVGPEFLLLRPATTGGDLVLPHAIGVHGLVLLAVPAVLLAGTALTARRQMAVVATAVGAVGVAMAVLIGHALRQLPLDALSAPALALLGMCAIALLAAWAVVVAARLRGGARYR
jgi:hypothetical protein